MEYVKLKNYPQYPSNTPKYTTSDSYWMQNNLFFDIPFCMHNNLNTNIKTFRTFYLWRTVLFPSVPLYWNHESWFNKNRKVVHDTKKRVNFQSLFLNTNYTFNFF